MREVSLEAARVELDTLLDAVERGEEIILTRRGKPVAKLVPLDTHHLPLRATEAVDQLVALRAGVTLGPELSLRSLIDAGRR